jgi:gliding motility-associated-like protein
VLDSTLAQTNGVFTNLTAGEHSVTVNNDLGCSATLTFTINNNGAITDTLTQTSCNPADVGTVTNTFVAMNGCDSTITVITTLLLSITDTLTQTSCNPADVGTVTNTFVAMNGCDSTVTVITTLIAPIDCNDNDCNTTDTYNDQTCQCDHTDILPPNCNDNNPNTLDTYNETSCECLHSELKTLLLPNAFSPNNDGVNDFWGITGLGINTIYLSIYNRWGEKVFETHNLTDTWDGKYKGFNCEIGVYAYYLTGTFNNNETFVRKGNISLVR